MYLTNSRIHLLRVHTAAGMFSSGMSITTLAWTLRLQKTRPDSCIPWMMMQTQCKLLTQSVAVSICASREAISPGWECAKGLLHSEVLTRPGVEEVLLWDNVWVSFWQSWQGDGKRHVLERCYKAWLASALLLASFHAISWRGLMATHRDQSAEVLRQTELEMAGSSCSFLGICLVHAM